MKGSLAYIGHQDVLDICVKYFKRNAIDKNPHHILQFEMVSYSFAGLGDVPTGFLSEQALLRVLCRHNNSHVTINFFVKFVPRGRSVKHAEYIESLGAFVKEVNLYANVIPQLQLQIGVEFAPVCYLTKGSQVLIFENLIDAGYSLARCSATLGAGMLDENHMAVSLNVIAALHASSIVYESVHNRALIDDYAAEITENSYVTVGTNVTMRSVWVRSSVRVLCKMIALLPEFRTQAKGIANHLTTLVMKIFEFVKPSTQFRNVFSHGDMWANNVMFRYDETVPAEAKLVDFQVARYAPPALDILTFIVNSTDSRFRDQYMAALLNHYYLQLDRELKKHYLDIQVEYPRQQFDDSCKHYYLAGLIEGSLFGHLVLLPNNITSRIVSGSGAFEEFIDANRLDICINAFETDAFYRTQMSDTLRQIVEQYILPML